MTAVEGEIRRTKRQNLINSQEREETAGTQSSVLRVRFRFFLVLFFTCAAERLMVSCIRIAAGCATMARAGFSSRPGQHRCRSSPPLRDPTPPSGDSRRKRVVGPGSPVQPGANAHAIRPPVKPPTSSSSLHQFPLFGDSRTSGHKPPGLCICAFGTSGGV
ncbi:hypothetical protein XENOCAPTIV_000812 [Xenoophorus captivus]|uniref:Uncharacterized protein n=1 Tax=Xenoophorus captivus TaxID=1517983 RepID=A0ABV0Q7E3_9TELE